MISRSLATTVELAVQHGRDDPPAPGMRSVRAKKALERVSTPTRTSSETCAMSGLLRCLSWKLATTRRLNPGKPPKSISSLVALDLGDG